MKKISIVTVAYNAVASIEATIQNVISQDFHDYEYIVIDGGSTDGTTSVIEKYSPRIDYYVSEPDKGIYDAMNKAIDVAQGEWILFMNVGDSFVNKHVLSEVFKQDNLSDYSVVYGDTIMKASWGTFVDKGKFFSPGDEHLPFCHQSTMVRTQLMKLYKFDLSYKVVADYNFFYSLYMRNESFLHIDKLISEYDTEGFSSQRALEAYVEVSKINGTFNSWGYRKKYLRLCIRNFMLKIIPNHFVEQIRKHRRSGSV